MSEQIKNIMVQAKAQVDEQWPNGEEAPIFEELYSDFKELITYIAGTYYGINPSDKNAVQGIINELMRI